MTLAARLCLVVLSLLAASAAVIAQPAGTRAAPTLAPTRVVSMNLCTDQLAMLIAAPGQLTAVSRLARDPVSSALAVEAAALPIHSGQAEAIHRLRPDLVLAGVYDPPATLSLLTRLGLRVEVFPLENSFEDIRTNVTRMGALLGRPDRAAALIAAMDARLAPAPPRRGPAPRAAHYSSSGYTSGAGTLADEILTAAGLANIAAETGGTGFVHLPLERLVLARPDLLVTGQEFASPALAQTLLHHPALDALDIPRPRVASNLWSCGTPLTARAVTALRAAVPTR